MKDSTVLRAGIIGSVIVAVCCFTPALVVLLGVAGLSAWLGWLDYVLFPALAIFFGLTAYGIYLRRRNAAANSDPADMQKKEQTL